MLGGGVWPTIVKVVHPSWFRLGGDFFLMEYKISPTKGKVGWGHPRAHSSAMVRVQKADANAGH